MSYATYVMSHDTHSLKVTTISASDSDSMTRQFCTLQISCIVMIIIVVNVLTNCVLNCYPRDRRHVSQCHQSSLVSSFIGIIIGFVILKASKKISSQCH